MSIQTITTPVIAKKMNYSDALAALANDPAIENLDFYTIDAIRFMVSKAAAKEKAALKVTDSPFKLASLFMAKKDPRYYLCGIHADGQTLTASNSHIAVRVAHECPAAIYDAMGVEIPDSKDWKMPNTSLWFDISSAEIDIESGINGMVGKTVAKVFGDKSFDAGYLKTIKRAGATRYEIATVSINGLYCLKFFGPNFSGVLMPLSK